MFLFFALLVPLPLCLGQDIESRGKSLISRYLESAEAQDREEILKALEVLGADLTKIKEWVRVGANYTPQPSGLQRKLLLIGERSFEYFV
ncbi:MAG TPA: hypothetical protein ACFYD3_04345 [Candidatus Hypogeohydataceae bacterium YC41]